MYQDYLKIKIKSLAEESKIIRREENKWRNRSRLAREIVRARRDLAVQSKDPENDPEIYQALVDRLAKLEATLVKRNQDNVKWSEDAAARANGMRNHRCSFLRDDSRNACLAYGFIRGMPYLNMERKCWLNPNWKRVLELAEKYGEDDVRNIRQRFEQWYQAGGAGWKK